MVEFETWSIGEVYYKVNIKHSDAYAKIKEVLGVDKDSYYSKDGNKFAWDVVVNDKELNKVKKILKEFS